MAEFKQLTTVSDYNGFAEDQLNKLFRWANRTKLDKCLPGINGMPLLSVGRCIEFLIDHGVSLKMLCAALAEDFHNNPQLQLIDILWDCVRSVLLISTDKAVGRLGWMKPPDMVTKGTMQQWISSRQWKELTDGEQVRVWKWAQSSPNSFMRIFYNLSGKPMLSVGNLLEFLLDHGLSLVDIFKQCMLYEDKEWNKMQLIDVLWERLKLVLKIPTK